MDRCHLQPAELVWFIFAIFDIDIYHEKICANIYVGILVKQERYPVLSLGETSYYFHIKKCGKHICAPFNLLRKSPLLSNVSLFFVQLIIFVKENKMT